MEFLAQHYVYLIVFWFLFQKNSNVYYNYSRFIRKNQVLQIYYPYTETFMKHIIRNRILLTSIASIALLAAGCESKPNTLERPIENSEQTKTNSDAGTIAGDMTTLEKKTINVANQEVNVEIANTDASRTQGLSGREFLAEGSGLLFDFRSSSMKRPGFWMKDMRISIDIIWIDENKIVGIESDVPIPPADTELPVYYPPSDITHVLEVPAGWSVKNNIVIGETVSL